MEEEIKAILIEVQRQGSLGYGVSELDIHKILCLAPFEKYARLIQAKKKYFKRETSHFKGDNADIERSAKEVFWKEIFEILSENEKAFYVREWLENNKSLFQRDNYLATWETRTVTDGKTCVFELGVTYLQITQLVWDVAGKRIAQIVYLYKGSIPTSLYFFETLLNHLKLDL